MTATTDFEALVVRIDAATDRLEMDVLQLEEIINDAEGAVSEELLNLRNEARAAAAQAVASAAAAKVSETNAQGFAAEALQSVIDAQAIVSAATVTINQSVANAQAAVTNARTEADRAEQAVLDAREVAEELLATAPFDEAPRDGRTYGRSNGDWKAVEGGSTGTGTVTSVNDIEPDANGNVDLPLPHVPTQVSELANDAHYITLAEVPTVSVPTKTSELENDSGFITTLPPIPTKTSELFNDSGFVKQTELQPVPTRTSELFNDSGFITIEQVPAQVIATDAPRDGKQYARQDNAWSEVVATGGGSSYTLPADFNHSSDGSAYRFYVNHKLFPTVEYSGYEWNNPATPASVSPADWNGDATKPITTNPFNAVDIRLLSVKKVNVATGAIIDDNLMGTTVSGGQFVSQGYTAVYAAPSGTNPGAVIAQSIKSGMLPGKWFIPGALMSIVAGQNSGLPTTMNGFNAVLEVTYLPFPGTAAFPLSSRRHMILTFWNLNSPTASKLSYMWQQNTASWVNIGTGTN